MDDNKLTKDRIVSESKHSCDHLLGKSLPHIFLSNQDGNLLKLNRFDTFRLVIYFYSLTGHPKKKLPDNWNKIPGAKGCTLENYNFRKNYDNFIKLNSLPIGVSTQSISEIKEMSVQLGIQYDILSDHNLDCVKKLSLPTFSVQNRVFIKKITIIVEKNTIIKVFFPIVSVDKHVNEVLTWLESN